MAINIYLENEQKAEIIAVLSEKHEAAFCYIYNDLVKYAQKKIGLDYKITQEREQTTLIQGIDFKLLREQKQALLDLLERDQTLEYLREVEIQALDGIIHLLDGLQDSAVDYGMSEEEVFGTLTEE